VYSDPTNVDDDLVESIVQPAASSANAPEVFRRIITGNGTSINRLLRKTRAPLLLLWGDKVKAPPCDESNCHAHVVLCMTPETCRDLCTMLAYNMMVAVALYNHLDSRERKLEDWYNLYCIIYQQSMCYSVWITWLVWLQDPWIRPASADKVMALYPAAQRIRLDAGHCPHVWSKSYPPYCIELQIITDCRMMEWMYSNRFY